MEDWWFSSNSRLNTCGHGFRIPLVCKTNLFFYIEVILITSLLKISMKHKEKGTQATSLVFVDNLDNSFYFSRWTLAVLSFYVNALYNALFSVICYILVQTKTKIISLFIKNKEYGLYIHRRVVSNSDCRRHMKKYFVFYRSVLSKKTISLLLTYIWPFFWT